MSIIPSYKTAQAAETKHGAIRNPIRAFCLSLWVSRRGESPSWSAEPYLVWPLIWWSRYWESWGHCKCSARWSRDSLAWRSAAGKSAEVRDEQVSHKGGRDSSSVTYINAYRMQASHRIDGGMKGPKLCEAGSKNIKEISTLKNWMFHIVNNCC